MRLIIGFAFLFLLLSAGRNVSACECVPLSQHKAFERAAAVFVGEVIEIKDSDVSLGRGLGNYSVAVRFKARQYWKGARAAEITIHTEQGALSCRTLKFEVGKTYLVYADGKYLVTFAGCSRSQPYGPEVEDLKQLGAGKAPKALKLRD